MKTIAVVLTALVFVGCATTPLRTEFLPGDPKCQNFPPTKMENVVLYTDDSYLPDRDYDVIGAVYISSRSSLTGGEMALEQVFNFMKIEAAKRGGDAVILEKPGEGERKVGRVEVNSDRSGKREYKVYRRSESANGFVGGIIRWR